MKTMKFRAWIVCDGKEYVGNVQGIGPLLYATRRCASMDAWCEDEIVKVNVTINPVRKRVRK